MTKDAFAGEHVFRFRCHQLIKRRGILETFGQRGETPTLHYGIRFWVLPNRFQIDATRGDQGGDPERRFYTLGLRFIF